MPTIASTLSLYSIPVVWFTTWYPHAWALINIQNSIGFTNVQPRNNVARLKENKSLSPQFVARVERMEGAHANGNEILPMWVAGVMAGNMAGLDNTTLNKHALTFIALRLFFNYTYINQGSELRGWFR
ncbi:hypothetical protein AMATHDRAFT_147870 [Amanita thiersii Skay4041]|uniref:Uncharacterized protein n=1 Tax=Amanita thiersii Skay4041 TaxID=703135 RepID=A0A2A9NE84_9AGAR|nr:hypothetical protein AMATHDRAFT_147870 [Amanita thiersii Skay4041]